MRKRKPDRLRIGGAYRMYRPFCQSPSNQIAIVTDIRQVTKASRQVEVSWLLPGPPWNLTTYNDFMRRVHSEAPTALN